jgi:hypothetical protein
LPVFTGLQTSEEAIRGDVKCSGGGGGRDYESGLHLAVYRLGEGRFVFNTFRFGPTSARYRRFPTGTRNREF